MRKIKWGVIGCGGIADRRTLPAMMNAKNAELIAVMDVNGEVANNCKEKYSAKYAFSNFYDLLKNVKISIGFLMRFHGYHQKIKEIEEMGNAIIQNIKAPVTIESAIYDQKVVEAAYKSSENRCFVKI